MLETGTSGLISGDVKRDDALPSAPALVLDFTTLSLRIHRVGLNGLAPVVVNAGSQPLQLVKAGSTMSDVSKSGSRPKLSGLGRQLSQDHASGTVCSPEVGMVLMYNPVEGID